MADELKLLYECKKVIVYGAMKNAADAVLLIEELFPQKLIGCAVSNMAGNVTSIYGIPVRVVDEYSDIENKQEICIVIAMRERYFSEIEEILRKYGFENILFMGAYSGIRDALKNEIMKKFEDYDTCEELINKLVHQNVLRALNKSRISEG